MSQEEELEQAISLVKTGKKSEAVPILKNIIKLDRNNERAWLWLSFCVDKADDKIYCFREVLRINPNNEHTRIALAQLEPNPTGGKDVIPTPQPAIIVERQSTPELIKNKMMYNGERNNYISVKCGNCNVSAT